MLVWSVWLNKFRILNCRRAHWLFGVSLLFLMLAPQAAYYESSVPFVSCSGLSCGLDDLLEVPVRIFNFLLGMAAFVLLLVIIWAGLRMILYHASEMPEAELVNAKMTLQRGIFGFLIIAFSYLLVNLLLYAVLGLYSNSGVARILREFGL